MNIDTEKLRRAVYEFQFYSRPSSATGSDPATVKDIFIKIHKGRCLWGLGLEKVSKLLLE